MPAYGQLVILINPRGKRYLRRVVEDQDIHGNDGIIAMADLAAAEFGTEVRSTKGIPYRVQEPTIYDLVRGVKRQTQIIYPKDISYICMRLGVGPGRKIIEAGSGSGSLTLGMSWFAGPTGQIFTHEAREEFMKLARRNLDWAGLGQNVTLIHRDISEGFVVDEADALFLDVRTPWEYLDHAVKAVKKGGTFGFILPTVDQVSKLLYGLERGPFDEIEVSEILVRRWKPIADRLRPEDRMVAHTGFLVFARHQEISEDWNSFRKLGTRERKQEAARLQRIADADAILGSASDGGYGDDE